MAKIAIVFHSGYGHTAKVTEHVKAGVESVPGASVTVLKADDLTNPEEGDWDELNTADAIIFGSPTYMGTASAVMKQFMEASSRIWFGQGWKDKIAAGFTNSASLNGDKSETLNQFQTFAMQHGMLWTGLGVQSGYSASDSDFESGLNRAGFYSGLATQALSDLPADQSPHKGDLETARAFGKRVAEVTLRWAKGA